MTFANSMDGDRRFLAQARVVLRQLAPLIRNSYFHDLANAVFDEPVDRFLVAVEAVCSHTGELSLERVGGELFANGARIPQEIETAQLYVLVSEEFEKLRLGGVRLEAGLASEEIRELLAVLTSVRSTSGVQVDSLNARLSAAGCVHAELLAARAEEQSSVPGRNRKDLRGAALGTYQEVLDFIKATFNELDAGGQLNQRRAKRVVHRLVNLSEEKAEGFSLFGLAAIKSHDHYTFNHMVNVCVLAIAFGQRLGLSRRQLAELGLAALYHDLGKVNIPVEVLNKPGRLNAEEWALMGNHTVHGARALFPLLERDLGAAPRIVAVLQHHYGFSGKGYPNLRLLKRQSLFARIIAVVDLFDAMTTKRVYQDEFLPDAALETMHRLAGEYCDPLVVRAFTSCIGIFPVGSAVELASNELAVVVRPSSDPEQPDRPQIRVVTDSSRRSTEPFLMDLASTGESGASIVRCVDPDAHGFDPASFSI